MTRSTPALGPESVTEMLLEAFERADVRSASSAARELFQRITNVDPYQLPKIFLHGAPIPDTASARTIRDYLAILLHARKADVSELLGNSDSRFSRNDSVDAEMLDRTYAILDTFARVAAALGPESAANWITAPHPAFEDLAPIQLLNTRYGHRLVDDLIDALLAGAYV